MRKEGKGRFKDFRSEVYYEGDWKKDVKHGFGTERFIDGSIYEGQYSRNTRNGRGTLRLPIGEVYVGDLKDNLMHGKGKYTWTSETHYTGDWLAGTGALETEGKEYVGDFVQGLKQGLGVLI